eukprot:CAMPEP_0176442464 /NCGR_PEP_ID=MMETSP0127-20121128/21829_1 /TAXON_ID=938130 /ORGANISM="Platyophrya macrostoma, Strain WH" /LENGTH=385 /DNA_ID=CAMNT_0017827479 /DNA_START=1 /DNA_END=1156 /DNA_ORIENTATION=-
MGFGTTSARGNFASQIPCRVSPYSPLNVLQFRPSNSTSSSASSLMSRTGSVSSVFGIAAAIQCRRRHGTTKEDESEGDGSDLITAQRSSLSSQEWSAQGLWVIDVKEHHLALAKGLVVAAILVLARLEALHLTGSEHGASRFLRTAQEGRPSVSRDSSAKNEEHHLHWCSLSTVCPLCTFLYAPSEDHDAWSSAEKAAAKAGGAEDSIMSPVTKSRSSLVEGPSSDTCVAQMILLALQQCISRRLRRTRLGRMPHVTTSNSSTRSAMTAGCSPPPQVVAVEALRLFLTRRNETLMDVLESLGCLFHAFADERDGPNSHHPHASTRRSSYFVRFYVPPVLPHAFPVPKLRTVLMRLHHDRLSHSRRSKMKTTSGAALRHDVPLSSP